MNKGSLILGLCCYIGLSVLSVCAEVIDIDNAEFQQLIDRNIVLVDIRTPAEWSETGIVPGSHLLMFFDENRRADPNTWLAELSKLAGPEDELILICRSGNRTKVVANFLSQQQGYRKVYNVAQGIRGWIASGKKTVAP